VFILKRNKYTYEKENLKQIFLSLLMDHIFYIISIFYIYFFKKWILWSHDLNAVSYSFDTIKDFMMVLRD